jgi:hypothetical protein
MKMWNSLNDTIRNVDNISKFKSELKKIDETENHAVSKHYLYGSRKMNIMLTHLRSSTSFLNYDLFRVGVVADRCKFIKKKKMGKILGLPRSTYTLNI